VVARCSGRPALYTARWSKDLVHVPLTELVVVRILSSLVQFISVQLVRCERFLMQRVARIVCGSRDLLGHDFQHHLACNHGVNANNTSRRSVAKYSLSANVAAGMVESEGVPGVRKRRRLA